MRRARIIVKKSLPMNAAGITIYPFGIYVRADHRESMRLIAHEKIHWKQQSAWFSKGWYFGLLAWYFLYLCVLPIGWNPWRHKWEEEAYREGSKYGPVTIQYRLKQKPYWLWWSK